MNPPNVLRKVFRFFRGGREDGAPPVRELPMDLGEKFEGQSEPTESQSPDQGHVSHCVLRPAHREREVPIWPVLEPELDAIGDANLSFTLWCSIGTGFLFLLGGCIWDMISDGQYEAIRTMFAAMVLLCALGSFAIAWIYRFRRSKWISGIKARGERGRSSFIGREESR